MLLRRPLLLVFMGGCVVSLLASGRLSARLIVDGAVSFTFVPIFEVMGLAAVYRRGPRRLTFARTVDLFFAGNAPWLLWLLGLAAFSCVQSPTQVPTWTVPPTAWIAVGSLVLIAVWSAYIDFRFCREVLGRPSGAALRDLVFFRAIAWSGATLYFLGYDIWPEVVGRLSA